MVTFDPEDPYFGRDPSRRRRRLPFFTIDDALSDREYAIYKAALAAAYGERRSYPQPRNPTAVEEHYLHAIEAFWDRRPTRGYDHIDRGNHRALLRLGRAKRRRSV